MYYYEVGYYSPENSNRTILLHDICYSEDEYRNIVVRAILDVISDPDCIGYRFEYADEDVVKVMIEKYGFRKLSLSGKFRCFGWASLVESDWEGDTEDDQDLTVLRKAVSERPEILKNAKARRRRAEEDL